ncbi:MAG TPA: DNA alkylation repair protein [Chryseolinea sp.]
MAELLKHMYNPQFFERLNAVLIETVPMFDERRFIFKVFDRTWPDLELKQRTRQITIALHEFMPSEFPEAAKVVTSISRSIQSREKKEQSYPFIFLPDYIELYGLENFDESMKAIEEITKLVSAEFAIRQFILKYPDAAMKQMRLWSKHKNPAVRRLASEGCRPRLPWSQELTMFRKDPSPILPILENLKTDPSEYVRRSVANNLNDIAKDNPSLVIKTARRWKSDSQETKWIIRHGCRTLLKKGVEEALRMHGFKTDRRCTVDHLNVSKTVRIGDYLAFDFVFRNLEKRSEQFRIEYVVHYLTSTGKISPKVFKIGEYNIEATSSVSISRRQSFKNFTTRKHYKGKHTLTILINGKPKARQDFEVG